MLTISYERETIHDPIDSFSVTLDDGKTVNEMLEAFMRVMLLMGYQQGSFDGKLNIENW